MKKNLLFACAALLALTTFNSCKDDDKDPDPAPAKTKTQLLTERNWKVVGLKADSGSVSQDLYPVLYADACNKDDEMNFDAASGSAANGTYVNSEGATKCNPNDPQTIDSGTWSFNSAQTTITTVDADTTTSTVNIAQLDANTLKVTTTDPSAPGWTITLTYGH